MRNVAFATSWNKITYFISVSFIIKNKNFKMDSLQFILLQVTKMFSIVVVNYNNPVSLLKQYFFI